MLIKEHDSVALSRSLPEHGLQIGDVGAVVFVHRNSEAYEVEFVTGGGVAKGGSSRRWRFCHPGV